MLATIKKRAAYIVLALAMLMGMPEAARFDMDGGSRHLWLCALWGLVAGAAVSAILLKVRRERRNGRSAY